MANIYQQIQQFFKSRASLHLGFWIVSVILLSYYSSLFGGTFKDNLIQMGVILPIQMTAAYLLIYVQIPQGIYRKKWLINVPLFFIAAFLFSVLARLATIYIAEPLTRYEGYDESLWEIISHPAYLIRVYMPLVYMPAFLLLIFKILKERSRQENRLISLEKEKSIAELNFLKAQMNPHFLFNTLNNIYALSMNQSAQTPEMILKLSDLLDYTIYECNGARVSVDKEWQLIENYVDLQAMRQEEKLMVLIDQQIDDKQAEVAPLILISLVENAFKHSLRQRGQDTTIKIFLAVKDKVLTFEVFNTLSSEKHAAEATAKKGIGVENVKKQLALQYPNRHQINRHITADAYRLNLIIQL